MRNGRRRGEDGAVAFEFALVVWPVLLIFLAVVQVALIGGARLLVVNAAARAARSAAVVVDDSPSRYGGEPPGITARRGSAPGVSLFDYRASAHLDLSAVFLRDRSRLETIRQAASLPLAVLAPAPATVLGWVRKVPRDDVPGSLGASLARAAFATAVYDDAVLAVTPTLTGPQDSIVVKVEYLFHCSVPFVSELLCKGLPSANLPNVPSASALRTIAATGERFVGLQAEATWPRQRYHHGGGGG